MVVLVEDTKVGALRPEGLTQARREAVVELEPKPLLFSAEIMNLYVLPVLRPEAMYCSSVGLFLE